MTVNAHMQKIGGLQQMVLADVIKKVLVDAMKKEMTDSRSKLKY